MLVAVRDGLDGDADCSVPGDDARVVVLRAARGVRLLMGVGVHACVLSVVFSCLGHYVMLRAACAACRVNVASARSVGRVCDMREVTSITWSGANASVSCFDSSPAQRRK